MRKYNKVSFLLIFFLPVLVYSQAPGYLGKKASLTFSISGFPALTGPTQHNYGNEKHTVGESAGRLGMNYEFEGNLFYVIGRYHSLGLYAGQYATGVYSEGLTFARRADYPTSGGVSTYQDLHDLLHRAEVRSVGIIYSIFSIRRGALAPVGNRFYVGVKHNFVTGKLAKKETSYYDEVIGAKYGHEPLDIDTQADYSFLLFGWSNDLMLTNRFMFRSGLRMALPISWRYLQEIFGDVDNYPGVGTNSQANYDLALIERLSRHELFRVDIGLGVLLF